MPKHPRQPDPAPIQIDLAGADSAPQVRFPVVVKVALPELAGIGASHLKDRGIDASPETMIVVADPASQADELRIDHLRIEGTAMATLSTAPPALRPPETEDRRD